MTPADILRAAAAGVEAETWCQHEYRNMSGQGCALWHLQQAGLSDVAAMRAAKDAVYRDLEGGSLTEWNDAPARDHFDVRDLFERTADRLDAEAACFAG